MIGGVRYMVELPELLTAAEVARVLRLHPKTPYQWAREGRIPFVRLGPGAIRFLPQDVERLIADRLVPARSA
jgi:excisionase family DNA binding protein